MIKSVLPYIASGGIVVWTLKLPNRDEKSPAQLARVEDNTKQVFKQYADELDNIKVVWLLANKNERTVIAYKK